MSLACIIGLVQGWLLKYAMVILMSVTTGESARVVRKSLQQSAHLLINICDQGIGLNMDLL